MLLELSSLRTPSACLHSACLQYHHFMDVIKVAILNYFFDITLVSYHYSRVEVYIVSLYVEIE